MTKNTLLLLSLLFVTKEFYSQRLTEQPSNFCDKNAFNIGYFGHKINNIGFQLGAEKKLASANNFNVLGSLQAIYFTEKDIQKALAIQGRFGQRFTSQIGLFFESYLGLGIEQTFYTDKIFEYQSGQNTIIEKKKNKTGIAPSIILGIGYDFNKKTNLPLKAYVRPSFNWVYPDKNLVFQNSYALETGIIFTLKSK